MSDLYFPQCTTNPATLAAIHTAAKQPTFEANPLGTVLFLSYIFATLVFIGIILSRHITAYHAIPQATRQEVGFNICLAVLYLAAVTSFAILSYNMLSFLIASFQSYHEMRATSDLSAIADLPARIWDWMYHSELFASFAWSLVRPAFWPTVESRLTYVMAATAYIATHRIDYDFSFVPYLALAQILPVSFSICLLHVEVLLAKPDEFFKWKRTSDPGRRATVTPALSSITNVAVSQAYLFLVAYVPCSVSTPQLLAQVLTSRALLLVLGSSSVGEWELLVIWFGAWASSYMAYLPYKTAAHRQLTWGLESEEFPWAVRTLYNDYVVLPVVGVMVRLVGEGIKSYANRRRKEVEIKDKGAAAYDGMTHSDADPGTLIQDVSQTSAVASSFASLEHRPFTGEIHSRKIVNK